MDGKNRQCGRGALAWTCAALGVLGVWVPGCSRDTEPLEVLASLSDLPAALQSQVTGDSDLKLGFAVYTRNCVGCHGINGDGQGISTVRLKVAPRDFTKGIFKFRSTANGQLPLDEDLHRTIRQGLKDSPMPAFEFLPERERSAVIAFIKLYSPRWTDPDEVRQRVELPESEPADLMTKDRVWRGRFGYVALGCNMCHGMTGHGDGPSSYTLVDDWGQAVRPYNYHRGAPKGGSTPLDIYRTFRTGVTPMPTYQSDTLGLVTQDLESTVFGRLVPEEQALIEPYIQQLPTMEQVQDWQANDPARYEEHSTQRAWDLVAYTLWLREQSKPVGERSAAIWPEREEKKE